MNYGHRFMTLTGDREQDHPQEKEMQKRKMLSEQALQIAVKRREVKSKGEKERYSFEKTLMLGKIEGRRRWR